MYAPRDSINPHAIVLHRTYGAWGGDSSVLQRGRVPSVHLLIGKDQGRWEQYYDTLIGCNHACDAKAWSVGIEFEGTNDEPLTDWQVLAGAVALRQIAGAHSIDVEAFYQQPVNMIRRIRDWHGVLCHNDVEAYTPGCDQHSDFVTVQDYHRITGMIHIIQNTPTTDPPKPAAIPIVQEFSLAAAKNALITLQHKGFGCYEGTYDPQLGRDPVILGVVGLGPDPEADGWWAESQDATFRAQPRNGTVIVTALAPHSVGAPLQCYVTVA